MIRFLIPLFLLPVLVSNSSAQEGDTVALQQSDSIRYHDSLMHQLLDYQQTMLEIEQKRKTDSAKKEELLRQIELLRERDQYQQADLQRQIAEIERKDSLRKAERQLRIISMKEKAIGFPVKPFQDTLFYIYTKIGPILPKDRATNIAAKIERLYEDDFFSTDSLALSHNESTIDIVYNDLIIMSVTDFDALWMEVTKETLAGRYLEIIKTSIRQERDQNSLINILTRAGLTILIIFILWLLIYALNNLNRRAKKWVISKKDVFFHGVKFRDYEILPPRRELDLLLKSMQVLKWLVLILLLYISLPLVFSIFPFTKGWANTLFSWIFDPAKDILLSIWNYLPNLFTIIVIFIATRYAIKLIRFLASEVEAGNLTISGFHQDWAMPTFNIARFLLYAFMFVVMFPYLPGSDSDVFKGVSVFLGILFSLGSSSAIANAVAGLVITYMRPFKVGDRVKIGDITGDVIEKTLLVTRIKTIKNEEITVPNSSILTGHTTNYSTISKEEGLILHTTVTIGYDVPWRQVHELLINAALEAEGVIKNKRPFVFQTSLDDFYVSYQLNAFTDNPNKMAACYSGLHQNIQDKFNEAGIEIMSPHYKGLRDGNMITIPENYRPEGYQPPSFNVENKGDKN